MNKIISKYIDRWKSPLYQYEKVSIKNIDLKSLIKVMESIDVHPTFENMVIKGFSLNNHEKIKQGMRIGK